MENDNNALPHPHSPDESSAYLRSWSSDGMELEVDDTEFREAHLTMQRLAHIMDHWDDPEAEGEVILIHTITASMGALGRMLGLLEHSDVCPYCFLDQLTPEEDPPNE